MAEDHSHHHDLDDLAGYSPQELAAMRWKAIQGLNAAPNLSPLAIRLGIALICHMDAKTRACFVGELRLSIELNSHILSIQKAKRQLKESGLITWFNPGGPRHLSHFNFDWAALLSLSDAADAAARKAIEKARLERRNATHNPAMDTSVNHSRRAVIKPFQKSPISPSIPANSQIHASQNKSHPSRRATPIPAVGLADITHDLTQKDIAEHHAIALDSAVSPQDNFFKTSKALASPTHKPICHFPQLTQGFENEPLLLDRILQLGFDQQTEANKRLSMKGIVKARQYILDQTSIGARK